MIRINFSSNVNLDFSNPEMIEIDEIINNFSNYEETEITKGPWYGDKGIVTIKYFNYKLSIKHDTLFSQFHIHKDAIESILNNNTFRYSMLEYDYNYLTFDYIDCNSGGGIHDGKYRYYNSGVRIRHFGEKVYKDSDGKIKYFSQTEYLKQELIVPRKEYMEKMSESLLKYIEFKLLVEKREIWIERFKSWKQEVQDLRLKVTNYPEFTLD